MKIYIIYSILLLLLAHALARSNDDKDALTRMIQCGIKITPEDAMGVSRAFTQTLNLINAAEVHHRMRILQLDDKNAEIISPLPMREDSVAGTINKLLNSKSESFINDNSEDRKKQIFNALLKQKVDIVMTAHPTEVNRRTLLRKYRSITEILGVLDRRELTPYERAQTLESLRREVASIWGSDEIRREKPSPQQEARGGLAILESVLWDAVPSYLRKLNAQCIESLGQELPLDHVPIRFSSWMGGDRDGNPNVTPEVTLEVSINQRLQTARLLLKDISALYSELAVCKSFTKEMLSLASEVKQSKDRFELYRRVLGHIKMRLLATINWCESELAKYNSEVVSGSFSSAAAAADITISKVKVDCEKDDSCDNTILGSPDSPFFDSDDILKPLKIMHNSLVSGGYGDVADGLLIDIIRRVATFGLTLAPLDIRQESTRHTQALDSICRYLGIGSYAQWDEQTKINWLSSELSGKRPLFRTRDIDNLGFDANVIDTLKTLEIGRAHV
jgi:phosphoenolpyruvate carboxylase